MKRSAQLMVLSVLAFGMSFAQASVFPADAEASYNLPALETYADRNAGRIDGFAAIAGPADAEASHDLAAVETYADRYAGEMQSWGVGKRELESVFPSAGGPVDD
jgi:hypothetical protein